LAGPGLADDPEYLPRLDVVADPGHCVHDAILGRELDRQIADVQDRLGHEWLGAGSPLRGVERVTKTVPDEVDAQGDDEDRETREGDEPPEREALALTVHDELPESRVRRLDAVADEGEERLGEDRGSDDERGEDDDRPDAIREDMARDDAQVARSGGLRRLDELLLAQREEKAAHDAREEHPEEQGED